MELDTGALVTLISDVTCQELFPGADIRELTVLLRTYSGEHLPVVGEMDVRVKYGEQHCDLALTVVSGEGPGLLGRNWLQYFKLDSREIRDTQKEVYSIYLISVRTYLQKGWEQSKSMFPSYM